MKQPPLIYLLLLSLMILSSPPVTADDMDDWGDWGMDSDRLEFIPELEHNESPRQLEMMPEQPLSAREQAIFNNLDNSTLSDYIAHGKTETFAEEPLLDQLERLEQLHNIDQLADIEAELITEVIATTRNLSTEEAAAVVEEILEQQGDLIDDAQRWDTENFQDYLPGSLPEDADLPLDGAMPEDLPEDTGLFEPIDSSDAIEIIDVLDDLEPGELEQLLAPFVDENGRLDIDRLEDFEQFEGIDLEEMSDDLMGVDE